MAAKNKSNGVQEHQQDDAEATPHMEVLKKLRIVIRSAQRHSNWIEKQCGVTGAQLWVMQELHEAPGLRVGDVSQKLAIHQTTTSNLVDALVKRGYVTKARDAEDLRVVKLQLTEKGVEVIHCAPAPARGLLPASLQKLDAQQLRDLDKSLPTLVEVIERADASYGMQPLPFTM